MNAQKQAKWISEMLLNGLHQMKKTREGEHSGVQFSVEDVEAFCRERANNIAQALMVDTTDILKTPETERALDRLVVVQRGLRRAIDEEGSPAVKDKYSQFENTIGDLFQALYIAQKNVEQSFDDLRKALEERL